MIAMSHLVKMTHADLEARAAYAAKKLAKADEVMSLMKELPFHDIEIVDMDQEAPLMGE